MADTDKKPCKECPWARACTPGALGGSPPETYIAQAYLGFWLPCHNSANYQGKASDANEVNECHGAAIYRSNVGVAPYMPSGILVLPENRELVFESAPEFYAHHKPCSLQAANAYLTYDRVQELMVKEWGDFRRRGTVQLKRRHNITDIDQYRRR